MSDAARKYWWKPLERNGRGPVKPKSGKIEVQITKKLSG
jgi:hypothetical protein